MDDVPLELNAALDRGALGRAFARTGRVHVAQVLTDASARRLHRALEHESSWHLLFNDGKAIREYESVNEQDHQSMAVAAWERAHSRFQYFYHIHRLVQDGKCRVGPDHYFARLIAFLDSENFLAFLREITGFGPMALSTSSATLYKPLDFLTIHDDGPVGKRLVAYVLNMTPEWRPDWGGALQFFDSSHHVEEAYLPTFNALNLFRVPKHHSVSQVSSFGGLRYSISGWFQSAGPDSTAARSGDLTATNGAP